MGERKLKRPRGEERKNRDLHLRATKTQMDFLEMLSYENEKSKTEMVWKALEFYYNCNKRSF